jgi:hypothetical protein
MLKLKSKPFWSINWGTIIFFICSWFGVYLLAQQPKPQEFLFVDSPLIPQDVLFLVSIPTNNKQWQSLNKWGTSELDQLLNTERNKITKNLGNLANYDIFPVLNRWVDREITIMYLGKELPLPEDLSKPISFPRVLLEQVTNQEALAIVIPLKNLLIVRHIWQTIQEKISNNFISKEYQNIKYYQLNQKDTIPYSITILGRSAVITTDNETMEKIINTYNNRTWLATPPGYQEAIKEIDLINPLARFYVNIPTLFKVAAPYSSGLVFPEQIERQTKQGIAGTISLASEGLRVEGIIWNQPKTNQKVQENKPIQWSKTASEVMAQKLPHGTQLMLNGSSMKLLWEGLVTESQSNPLLPISLQPALLSNWIKSVTGLEWEKDFLPWIGDQGVLAVIPPIFPNTKSSQNTWLAMIEVSDRTYADKIWLKLDQIVADRHQLEVKIIEKNGKFIKQWIAHPQEDNQQESSKIIMSHGWLEGNLKFFTWGGNNFNYIIPQPVPNLNENLLFKQVILAGLNPNHSQLFLNLENNSKIPGLILRGRKKTLMDTVKSLGLTVFNNDQDQVIWKLVLHLKEK